MRVLHIASGDLWGGAEAQLCSLVTELYQFRDVTVQVVLFNHGLVEQRLRSAGISVQIIDEARMSPIQLLWRVIVFIRSWRPDLVHTHGYKECIFGSLATMASRRIFRLRTVHGWVESHPRFWHVKKLLVRGAELVMLAWQHTVIAVSDELRSRLTVIVNPRKIVVIENGIDLDEMRQVAKRGERSGKRRGEIHVAIIGRLVRVKRVDLFLRVCKLLRAQYGSELTCLVIGDGPLMEEIREQVRTLGLEHQTILTGFVHDISTRLMDIDVLLITSDHEGLPMVLLEAMAMGVPVVAHAVGGIVAALEGGACGWLVSRQDPENYYMAAKDVIENKTDIKKRVTRARDRVINFYSGHQTAQRYWELYRQLLASAT